MVKIYIFPGTPTVHLILVLSGFFWHFSDFYFVMGIFAMLIHLEDRMELLHSIKYLLFAEVISGIVMSLMEAIGVIPMVRKLPDSG